MSPLCGAKLVVHNSLCVGTSLLSHERTAGKVRSRVDVDILLTSTYDHEIRICAVKSIIYLPESRI